MSNKIVPAIYRAIIDDVINSIKPEFDEYGVSEDVLAELQHKWETKMLASHVAEFDMTAAQQQHGPPAPHRHYPPHPMIPHYPPSHNYGAIPAPGQPPVKSEPVDGRYLFNGPQGMPSYALPPLPGPQIPGAPRPGSQPVMSYSGPPPTARTSYPPAQPASSTPSQPQQPQKIPQVDGPSSSGSDSPSPPPHGGYAPHSQHPSLPQPIQASPSSSRPIDSEAINSDLDDSDSEEEEEAQEEGPGDGDIVFCTYDKVARVKNKWKCILKDGMIHVNGKDYLFAKCTGEFEW